MDSKILNFEIKRKLFHLCSIIIPIFYIATSKFAMCMMLAIITGATLFLDISRHHNIKIQEWVEKFLGKFLRTKEASGNRVLSGSSYMATGFLISCIFFPKSLAITSWLILIISDSVAAIIGMKFGSPLFNGKSYEGAVAFFVSTFLISIMCYVAIDLRTSFFIIIMSSFLTSLVEFFSEQIKINDNLSIPLTYGFSTVSLLFIL